ncbi:MAG: glycosyl transferase family 1, partial [candidate division NC10 bacterium]
MTSGSIPIDAYREVAPPGVVDFLLRLADRVRGRRFVHVNSTRLGGGVAEILNRLVPMLTELGVDTAWEVI